MRPLPGILAGLLAVSLAFGMAVRGQGQVLSLNVVRLLTPAIAAQYRLGTLGPSFAIAPNGVGVVGDGDRLWAVGACGAVAVAGVRQAASFAITPAGLLAVVSGANLDYLDPASKTLKFIYALPALGMRVVADGDDGFWLFGPDGAKGFALYELLPGRKVAKVIDSPHPITGVARSGDQLLIITGGALFSIDGGSMQLVVAESGGTLRSVAVDPDSHRNFLDGSRTLEFKGTTLVPLFVDVGGELGWAGGGLLVFNPRQTYLSQFANLP